MQYMSAAAKGKARSLSEKKGSTAKQRKPKGSAPSPEHADELAAAGVAAEEPEEAAASESRSGSDLESAEEDEGTSAKKAKKMAILKPPGAKQKPGKVFHGFQAAAPKHLSGMMMVLTCTAGIVIPPELCLRARSACLGASWLQPPDINRHLGYRRA